jgi:hypothetical protein
LVGLEPIDEAQERRLAGSRRAEGAGHLHFREIGGRRSVGRGPSGRRPGSDRRLARRPRSAARCSSPSRPYRTSVRNPANVEGEASGASCGQNYTVSEGPSLLCKQAPCLDGHDAEPGGTPGRPGCRRGRDLLDFHRTLCGRVSRSQRRGLAKV